MKLKAQIMDEAALRRALMRISHEITEKNKGVDNVVLVGIRRRGEPIARMIQQNIEKIEGVTVPCGSIDIGFYRDDLTTITESPLVRRAELDFDVTAKDVVLTDDVLYTGRTARAAIEAVFSCGRPLLLGKTTFSPKMLRIHRCAAAVPFLVHRDHRAVGDAQRADAAIGQPGERIGGVH